MPIRVLSRKPRRLATLARAAMLSTALVSAGGIQAGAQMIQIKTLPIAEGDQWRFFPSANVGLGGVSIALADSLLDPFENPAKGSRLSERGKGLFFGSPTFYSVSKNAGGGRTLPLGGIIRSGSNFGGLAVAIQEIDAINQSQRFFPTPVVAVDPARNVVIDQAPVVTQGTPSRQNKFAFATAGHLFEKAGISVGASALWSGLNDIDGVDLLYAGSQRIDQHGGSLNARLGLLKEWSGGRSAEAIFLHNRFNMAHDVTWVDQVWDPNSRQFASLARIDHNLDRTNLWGMHLGFSQPLGDSGWRAGAIATTNLMSHPKLPDFRVVQVMTIPWDPGHSAAYDFGLGVSKVTGLTTFGIDAIYEPIHTHTWGETPDSIVTGTRTVPAGSKTTENHYHFSNAILRSGFAREIPIDTMRGAIRSVRLEGGLVLRSIDYRLNQRDHVALTTREQTENWVEWTRTWGVGIRFSDLLIKYVGRTTTGTGRPGVFSNGGSVVTPAALADAGSNFISAPSGSTTLTGVAVTTHQFSVSIPIR